MTGIRDACSIEDPITEPDFDVVIIGAGAAGLYALHRVRGLGLSAKVFEKGDGVGGTWYWNRYPGARCDVESWDYCYTFSEELEQEWEWTERFPTQPELERYFNYVADRFDLRRDIDFDTRVDQARFDDDRNRWIIRTSRDVTVSARFVVSAAGCLSEVNTPRFEGAETFEGQQIHTARWPKEGIDVTGMRVGVIGTGSTGVQAIPQLAKQAEHLFVFQRTPQFAIPARNRPIDDATLEELKHNYRERWELKKASPVGMGRRPPEVSSALEVDEATRTKIMEDSWALGGPGFARTFDDVMTNADSNQLTSEFVQDKIREKVADSAVAESLLAIDHPLGARRLIVEIDYFETYNRPNVTLVDVAANPITEITPEGLRTTEGSYDLDLIVYATGFDGMTGALLAMDIQGVGGMALRDKWANGAGAYLGLVASGFPNLFMITGPGSPRGVQQRDLLHRTTRRLDHRLPGPHDRKQSRPHRLRPRGRSRMDPASPRDRRPVHRGQDRLLVDRRQHRGQAPRRHLLPRRHPHLPRNLRRNSRQRLRRLRLPTSQ